jgi:hypothetical protein
MRGFAVIAARLDGLGYWMLRPNRARVHPALELETWDAVADGQHNSNTDLIVWKGSSLLCHAASPYGMGSARTGHDSSRVIVGAAAFWGMPVILWPRFQPALCTETVPPRRSFTYIKGSHQKQHPANCTKERDRLPEDDEQQPSLEGHHCGICSLPQCQ